MNFSKYEGAGNDFILIDDRDELFLAENTALVKAMCDRHFGIGADGLILLQLTEGFDFKMVYFNADGNQSTMCGNGGRCITAFAHRLKLIDERAQFIAVDGSHLAKVLDDGSISLQMNDVLSVEVLENHDMILNTGSPHYVTFNHQVNDLDVVEAGRRVRYSDRFKEQGVNVNFAEIQDKVIDVRTYERGVENETLACGTGVTAVAIAAALQMGFNSPIQVNAVGGKLQVSFDKNGNTFTNIWKTGPATWVFDGIWKK